ncbi:DNA-formamidopyrimidine glycosylase [bacterium]|nr:DNA-formamidopyrimidine glycosylase [bacterium]
MPELPEVETIKTDLEKIILGKKIKVAEIKAAKIIKEPSAEEFAGKIKEEIIKKIIRRGKYLIFEFLSGKYLVIHLKMTGQLIYGDKNKQSKISFLLGNGQYLNFCDWRLFGEIRLIDDLEKFKGISKLGIEPLDIKFTIRMFYEMIKKKRSKIKSLLMDQSFIAGIGNIYAQESLFKAKIHPAKIALNLSKNESDKLFFSIKEVLTEAIKYRGSSINTYLDLEGRKGSMGERLRIYGRKGKPCFRCKSIVVGMKIAGRGTAFCPNCQK